jgi:NAD(P)-dependent dehydrogenase (short-subunit alcohol dehydrogenase family)
MGGPLRSAEAAQVPDPDPLRPFAGRAAMVSGATSGIGRATALLFAARGADVAVCGRDPDRGEAAARACAGLGVRAVFVRADLAEPGAAAAMVDEAAGRLGRLDVAVNAAGMQERRAPLADMDPDVLDRVLAVNVRAVALAMKAQVAAFRARGGGGSIVNVASVSGTRNAYPGLAAYAASKAAVLALTRAAALELAPEGIRVNSVSPGRIETPMMLASGVADMAAVAAGLPARRLGAPDEAAAAVVWLCSDEARFVVGHDLRVDGGFLAS